MKAKFGREPKMMTTEPSDDNLKGEGMKKGGKAMGGAMMSRDAMPSREMPMRSAMPKRRAMAMQPALLTRKKGGKAHHADGGLENGEGPVSDNENFSMKPYVKKLVKKAHGGEVESKAMQHKEDAEIHKVEKELKHHESMGAKKAHKGLKMGGMTGDIEGKGYKKGGSMTGTLKPKIDVQDKVVGAKQVKGFNTKTKGLEGKGYKKGGTISQNVANSHLNSMSDGSNPTKKVGKTGEIKQAPAGYRDGGSVMCHAEGGHTSMSMRSGEHGHKKMDCSPMKMGGSTSTKSKKNY